MAAAGSRQSAPPLRKCSTGSSDTTPLPQDAPLIVGEAERSLDISRTDSEQAIASALSLDGSLDEEPLENFLDRVRTPETNDT
jgi:hypothetical protein